MTTAIQRVRKSAWEWKHFEMGGFSSEMATGDTVDTAYVPTSSPAGLTFDTINSSLDADGNVVVQFRVAGGTTGVVYTISSRILTTLGDQVESFGEMEIVEA